MHSAIQERHGGVECEGSKTGAQGLECLKQAGLWTTLGTGPSQGLEWGSGTLPSIRPSAGGAQDRQGVG